MEKTTRGKLSRREFIKTGAAGLGVAALGHVADVHGLRAALVAAAAMPVVAFVTARFLPPARA